MTAREKAARRQIRTVRRPALSDCPAAWMREVPFDLLGCMRQHRCSIRDLAARMGLTLKTIRERRTRSTFLLTDAVAYFEAIMQVGDYATETTIQAA